MSRTLGLAVLSAIALLLALSDLARAENWPGWRGPRGDGTSLEREVPTAWNGTTGRNVAWRVPLPGQGHASPIVWENRVFLVSCLPERLDRVLLCVDRDTGDLLWQRTVLHAPLETKHARNSYASGTPATDGTSVFVTFLEVDGTTIPAPNVSQVRPVTPGQMLVAAYDFSGRRKWLVRCGNFVSAHGYCSCPVLHGDLLILNGDHDGESYLVALDKMTGETVWKVARPNQTRSYATPLIRNAGGRSQMVLPGSKSVTSYAPGDGSRHWTIDGPTEQFVASAVFDGELFFVVAGFPTYHVMAIRPEGSGNVTDTHVAWHSRKASCYVPSPIVVGEYLLVADDRGTASCFQAATGERLWQTRLGKHFNSSLVTAEGLVYFLAEDGITRLVRPGPAPDIVAENPLGEDSYASPAISGGRLFLRGEKHLFCIAAEVESR